MARTKKTEGPAVTVTSAEQPEPPTTSPGNNGPADAPALANDNGEKRKPIVSYRLSSDRTTSIELAVWSNTFTSKEGEPYEQLSVTIQRSYKDANGAWCKGGSWRIH